MRLIGLARRRDGLERRRDQGHRRRRGLDRWRRPASAGSAMRRPSVRLDAAVGSGSMRSAAGSIAGERRLESAAARARAAAAPARPCAAGRERARLRLEPRESSAPKRDGSSASGRELGVVVGSTAAIEHDGDRGSDTPRARQHVGWARLEAGEGRKPQGSGSGSGTMLWDGGGTPPLSPAVPRPHHARSGRTGETGSAGRWPDFPRGERRRRSRLAAERESTSAGREADGESISRLGRMPCAGRGSRGARRRTGVTPARRGGRPARRGPRRPHQLEHAEDERPARACGERRQDERFFSSAREVRPASQHRRPLNPGNGSHGKRIRRASRLATAASRPPRAAIWSRILMLACDQEDRMRRVAVIGVGVTKFGKHDRTSAELFAEAAADALADAELPRQRRPGALLRQRGGRRDRAAAPHRAAGRLRARHPHRPHHPLRDRVRQLATRRSGTP